MTAPVPHHLRHPRRAYGADGRAIVPPTIGADRADGTHTLEIICGSCPRSIILGTAGLPDDLALPDVPRHLRLRCSGCGSRNIGVMRDMAAHYAKVHRPEGFAATALPEGYRVVHWRDLVGQRRTVKPEPGR